MKLIQYLVKPGYYLYPGWLFYLNRDQVFPGCGSAYAVYGKNLFSGFLIGFEGVDGVGICGPGEFQGFSVLAFEASGS